MTNDYLYTLFKEFYESRLEHEQAIYSDVSEFYRDFSLHGILFNHILPDTDENNEVKNLLREYEEKSKNGAHRVSKKKHSESLCGNCATAITTKFNKYPYFVRLLKIEGDDYKDYLTRTVVDLTENDNVVLSSYGEAPTSEKQMTPAGAKRKIIGNQEISEHTTATRNERTELTKDGISLMTKLVQHLSKYLSDE